MTATQQKTIHRKAARPPSGGAAGLSSLPLQQKVGNQTLSDYLFSAYRVSHPAETREVEADRAADRVMSGGQVHTQPSAGGGGALSRSAETGASTGAGGSTGLPGAVRDRMEGGFGRSFEGVRLHHDGRADALSRALHAKAFTQGSDVYFRRGAYDPGSRKGQRLIAHELAHVDQNRGKEIHRTPEDLKSRDELLILYDSDPAFKGFIDDLDPEIIHFAAFVPPAKKEEEDEAAADKAAAAKAVEGASGTGGAIARGVYGKRGTNIAGGVFQTLGSLGMEAGTIYSSIATAELIEGDKNTNKGNAKFLSAAGQLTGMVGDAFHMYAKHKDVSDVKEKLDKVKSAEEERAEVKSKINEAKDKIPAGNDQAKRILETIETKVEQGEPDVQKDLLKFINDNKNVPELNECNVALKAVLSDAGRLGNRQDQRKEAVERKKGQLTGKQNSLKNSGGAFAGLAGRIISSAGAAFEGVGLHNKNIGIMTPKVAGIVGSVMSALGGIVSSIGGAFNSADKAKKAAGTERRAMEAEKHAGTFLTGLYGKLKEVQGKKFDEQAYRNLQENDESEKVNEWLCVREAYNDLLTEGVDVGAFTAACEEKEPGKVKRVVISSITG